MSKGDYRPPTKDEQESLVEGLENSSTPLKRVRGRSL